MMHPSELDASAPMPVVGQPVPNPPAAMTVQKRAAILEAELAALRQLEGVITSIRSLKRRYPEMFEDFGKQLQSAIEDDPTEQEPETATRQIPDQEVPLSGFERLVALFRTRNNESMTAAQMAKAIGLRPLTIKSMLYERHREKFVTVERRGKRNEAYFCLAEG
jgi:hypothetical protein